jgi:hypothetical protein
VLAALTTFERECMVGGEPAVGQRLDSLGVDALAVGRCPVADDVATVERRRVLRDARGGAELLRGRVQIGRYRASGSPTVEHGVELVAVQPDLRGA